MKSRRILVFFICVIMIISSILIPVSFANKTKIEQFSDTKLTESVTINYDLSIKSCYLYYTGLSEYNSNMAVYKLEFYLKNEGNRVYPGGYLSFRIKTPIGTMYSPKFDQNIGEFGIGLTMVFEDTFWFYTTGDDSEKNEELDIVGKTFTVELMIEDLNLKNNKCSGIIGYKQGNSQPTYSQIRQIMREIKSEMQYMDSNIFHETPLVFQERLGWVYDFSEQLYEIKRAVISLYNGANDEGIDLSNEKDLIINWIDRFNLFLEDLNIDSFEEMIDNSSDVISYMNDTIIKLKQNEIDLKFIDMAEAISVFINETVQWIEEEHWEDPILVEGDITGNKYIRKFEKKIIFLFCGNLTGKFKESYKFEFDPNSSYENNKKLHSCELGAFTFFYDSVFSPDVTSMAFSGGKIVYDIHFDTRLKGREDNLKNLFMIWLFFIL